MMVGAKGMQSGDLWPRYTFVDKSEVVTCFQVISLQSEEPHTVQTRVVWLVNVVETGCSVVTNNCIYMEHLEEMLIKEEEQSQMSREDIKFIKSSSKQWFDWLSGFAVDHCIKPQDFGECIIVLMPVKLDMVRPHTSDWKVVIMCIFFIFLLEKPK